MRPALLLSGCAFIGAVIAAVLTQIYLDWQPCVLCVEIRAWMLGTGLLLIAAAAAGTGSRLRGLLALLGTCCTFGAAWSGYHLLSIEQGWVQSFSCSPFARFPSWLPLQVWVPAVFQPQAICGDAIKSFVIPLSSWPILMMLVHVICMIFMIIKHRKLSR